MDFPLFSDSEAEFSALYQKAIENTKQLAAAVTQIGAMDQVAFKKDTHNHKLIILSLINAFLHLGFGHTSGLSRTSRKTVKHNFKKKKN